MIYPLIKYITNALSFGKKKTTIEILEDLDKKIKQYESNKQKNQLNERKYVGALMLYSIVVYIFGAIVYYLYLMPVTFSDRIKSLIPFLITPIIIYFTRKFLKWYYVKRVVQIENKLVELKDEKKKILEEVKEKETYKKAKEILEKFSENEVPPATPSLNHKTPLKPPQSQQLQPPGSQQIRPVINSNGSNNVFVSKPFLNSNDLARSTPRPVAPPGAPQLISNGSGNYQATPIRPNSVQQTPMMIPTVNQSGSISSFTNNERVTRTLVPRPFIPQERTTLDKLLDFLVGDGPSNRYALICKKCSCHNGMALKEEFEYIAFRCAYCLEFNDSRKKKLDVPKEIVKPIYAENTNSQNNSNKNKSDNQLDQEAQNREEKEEGGEQEEGKKEKTTTISDENNRNDSIPNQQDTSDNNDEKMETSDTFETNNNNTNVIEKKQEDKKND